jgi:hypothetical protein
VESFTYEKTVNTTLVNFQEEYWSFVSQVKDAPLDFDQCRDMYASKIRKSLRELEGEISALRKKKGYAWLRRIGDDVYTLALSGTAVGALCSMGSRMLLIGPVAGWFVGQLAKVANDLLSEKEQINNVIEKSSFGYLWKAQERFRTK